ncbi:hypothetical protein RJ639_038535 [Escallonia herrerae]|uniref:Gamma-glutamylcyclotransferase family protein n=1 Tax=Escallonia herrerae TaxID=1293975 RepID=A0AA89BAH1_9ASTE|nr:hypothetical protein RJ639_038535 [Escallonia herrerae]
MPGGTDGSDRTLIFTYGTLKRGFANHSLMQALISSNDAVFLGQHRTDIKLPLVCGPHGVPFLLNLPGSGLHLIRGELYSVSTRGLRHLDDLEGITLGHYERLPIRVIPAEDDGTRGGNATAAVEAEAYYAHRSFAEEMWRRSGGVGFGEYAVDAAKKYVKREARPKDRSFLDEIRLFCSSN